MPIRVMSATISAIAIAGVMTLNAQTPNPQTPQQQPRTQPQTQPPATPPAAQQPRTDQRDAAGTQARANAGERVLTVTGCLQAEKDVPGRRESMTERAGMGEDYILTNVKMAQGAATSGIGLGSMYQIKGGAVNDSELKKHLGHQIEVTGSIENNSDIRGGMAGRSDSPRDGTRATTAAGNSNLPNLQAASIKMVAATCQVQQ
ncbi:MAG TPA: hypothetical protein VFZ31_01855 [Vicinamibacterales bacterium]